MSALRPAFAALLGSPTPSSGSTGLRPAFAALLQPPQVTSQTPVQAAAQKWASTPGWEKPLEFAGRGLRDAFEGAKHALAPSNPTALRVEGASMGLPVPSAQQAAQVAAAAPKGPTANDQMWSALEAAHPWLNYGVRWPAMLAAAAPLGEGAGAAAEGVLGAAPEGAGLVARFLRQLPASAARGAGYGVQQPTGSPAVNAAAGAVAGPLAEGAARVGGGALRLGAQTLLGAIRRIAPQQLALPQIDALLARRLSARGLPASVTPRESVPGVMLPTGVQSGDRNLIALQSAERLHGIDQDFNEMTSQNNRAIDQGLRTALSPVSDNAALSAQAHGLLQQAQNAARAKVNAAYAPFDAIKGGVYLEPKAVQGPLKEAWASLLPAHQEGLPAKLTEIMHAQRPLRLSTDIEDLQARLNDAYRSAVPHTTQSRAAAVMREALAQGRDAAQLTNAAGEGNPSEAALQAWEGGRTANQAFRKQFPQGGPKDSEARQWLSRWLLGGKDDSKFLTESSQLPGRARAVLGAFDDSPQEQEQMRGLMRGHYVNRLLGVSKQGAPGERALNAEGIERLRQNNSALENAILTPAERETLDRYVGAARDNAKILQRLHTGSSETAALRNYTEDNPSVAQEALKHGASALHPVLGAVVHLLPALAKTPDNSAAIGQRLREALLDPAVYNRIMQRSAPPSAFSRTLAGIPPAVRAALSRSLLFSLAHQAAAARANPP